MFRTLRRHRAYAVTLWREGLWGRWLGAIYTLAGLFVFIRDDWWQPTDDSRWKLVAMIPHFTWEQWALGASATALFWVFEASYWVHGRKDRQIEALKGPMLLPLEITFDASNPAQRFWKRTQAKDKDGNTLAVTLWEYRVGIRNKSNRTVRNVRVSVESSGLMPVDPHDLGFLKDSKDCRDIPPHYTEFVPVWYVWPPQPGDAWGPTATAFHGPIRIIARGDDVAPSEALFEYCPEETPVLVMQRRR
jgi:hypothetical protein